MRRFHNNRGAISVFLVLILVPCMLITSIFVDISRVYLARTVSESSADLALSTLMSSYDYDLAEYYGLMGSCQNISDYYETAASYYDIPLHSRDVQDEEVRLLYQRVASQAGGWFGDEETISDLLRIQNQSAKVSALDGANMYNATILQEQIVEFMKYRGPIVIGQEIIEKIKNAPGVNDALEGDVNKTIVDKKQEFYEAEGELLQKAFDVYWDTRAYTDKVGDHGENMSSEKLREYADKLVAYRSVYEEIHGYVVGNLTNTANLTAYQRVTMDLDEYTDDYDKTSEEVYSRMETPAPAASPAPGASPAPTPSASPEPVYYIDGDRATALLNELKTAREDFITAKNDYITACESLLSTPPGTAQTDAHYIQWWVRMNNAVNASGGTNYTDNLKNKAQAMLKAYARLEAAGECTPGNNMPANWENDRKQQLGDTKSAQGQYLVAGIVNDTDKYLRAVNLLEQVSAAHAGEISAAGLYVTVDGQNLALDQAVGKVQSGLSDMYQEMDDYIRLLNKVIDKPDPKTDAEIDQLEKLAGQYSNKLNTWENSANNTGTTLAGKHIDEISDIRTTGTESLDSDSGAAGASDADSQKMAMSIDAAAVREMKTRLTNIRSQYQTMKDAIEKMLYGSEKLLQIADASSMVTHSGAVVKAEEIGLTNEEVKDYAADTFSRLFQPTGDKIAELHEMEGSSENISYNPLMSPATKQIDTPELYVYMHGKFKDISREKVNEQKQEQDNAKKQKEDAEKKAKDANRYHGDGKGIATTKQSIGNGYSLGKGIGGLIGIVKSLCDGQVDDIRDHLYVTAYMMEMFSYATFEEEGYYSLLSEEEQKTLSLKEESSNYYTTVYNRHKGTAQTDKTWLSARPQDAYNKTLTNRLINKENNAAYLAEVEYILYGKTTQDKNGAVVSDNAANVKAAYADIYTIRYALNLVSAFANFWGGGTPTGDAINGIAKIIMGLTNGIIPAAVTKVLLLPILTVFETGKDMDRLQAGLPVELYKGADDWWYSIPEGLDSVSGFMGAFGKEPEGKNSGGGLQYSDYLTLFVYLGLAANDKGSEKMYLRMADVIQANMREATDDTSYALNKTQVYFRLNATLRVEPMMLALPLFSDQEEQFNELYRKKDWCTFNVETIRGY